MPITLGQLNEILGGELLGDADCLIEAAGPIDQAGAGDIAFVEKGPHLKLLEGTQASAVIVPRGIADPTKNILQVDQPRLAFAKTATLLHPMRRPPPGAHPSAIVGQDCQIGKEVSIGAGAVVGHRVTLGERVVLHPMVVVGDDVCIGDDTTIYPHVSILERCRIGSRVIVHAGTVIGSDGFGFVQEKGHHIKVPQTGIVQIDDDVEIGANCTIDRATFGKTWIGQGVKTDNLVHIAHNVELGEHSLIVAQVGIAGSTTIGHHVILAGQAGIAGHLTIGNEVIVGPQTGVGQSIEDKKIVSSGLPAMPHGTWLRVQNILPKLPDLGKQLRQLEKRIAALEKENSAMLP